MSGETGFKWRVGQTLTKEDVAELEETALANGGQISRLFKDVDKQQDIMRDLLRVVRQEPMLNIDGGDLPAAMDAAGDLFFALNLRAENAERDFKATRELREHDVKERDGAIEEIARLRNFIDTSRREHFVGPDPWEGCPQAKGAQHGISSRLAEGKCNCGADEWNMRIEEFLSADDNAVTRIKAKRTLPTLENPSPGGTKTMSPEWLQEVAGVLDRVAGISEKPAAAYEMANDLRTHAQELRKLKLDMEVLKACARPGSPLPCGHPERFAYCLDGHGQHIQCAMCLVVRLSRELAPLTTHMIDTEAVDVVKAIEEAEKVAAHFISTDSDGPTPPSIIATACTGCKDLERKGEMIGILIEGIGGNVDAAWTAEYARELVSRAIRYVAGDENLWGGHEPGGSIVLAVLDRFAGLKARVADLELALKDDANLRAFCDREILSDNRALKTKILKLEAKEHELQDSLASADEKIEDLEERIAELEQLYGVACERLQELGEESVPLVSEKDDRVGEADVPVEADKPGDLDYCACGGAERIAELKKVLANTMRYNQTAPERLAEIEPQFDAAKKQIDEMNMELLRMKSIEEEIARLRETITTMRGEAKTLGSDNHKLGEVLDKIAEIACRGGNPHADCLEIEELIVATLAGLPKTSEKDERITRLEAKVRGHLMMSQIGARISEHNADGGPAYSLGVLGADMRTALAWFKKGHGAQVEDQD